MGIKSKCRLFRGKGKSGKLILQAYRTLVPGQTVIQGPNGGGWRPQNFGLAELSSIV
jgi:hypothetical protein